MSDVLTAGAPYPEAVRGLPVASYLDEICTSLKASRSRFLVLTAQTAAGKSTAVPLALLRHFSGSVYMLEPRRLAVLAIASRVASLLGEEPGQTAGYSMHLESAVSERTRLLVMTEAVLTRRLQQDPGLEGCSVVVIDEFHERSIHADMALAFLKEAMQLRDDLYVIVMSATMDTQTLAAYLGGDDGSAPVFNVPGRQFPVAITYAGGISAAQAVMQELAVGQDGSGAARTQTGGSILVFLPGIRDIRRCREELVRSGAADRYGADILMLHSSVSFAEQKKVLCPPGPGEPRRVILSSAIAETSLTVPDVTVVIDSGLSRINRMNVAAGMELLVTESESAFSADQRAGRAGRTAPGRCVRLWKEHEQRPRRTPPEILRTDLAQLVLECAEWGASAPETLSWLDMPPKAAWNAARELLLLLGCLDADGHCTERGRAVLTLGLTPRLACAALEGEGAVPVVLAYSSYRDSAPAVQKKFRDDICRRLRRLPQGVLRDKPAGDAHRDAAQVVPLEQRALLAGFPDRLARLTEPGARMYRFPSGRIACIPEEKQACAAEWIVAPEVDAGERSGVIYSCTPVSAECAEAWLAGRTQVRTEVSFVPGGRKIRKMQYTCYGRIILSEKQLVPQAQDTVEAVCHAVISEGLDWLPLSDETQSLLVRARFYNQQAASPLAHSPEPEELAGQVHDWLVPFLTSGDVSAGTVFDALYWWLDGGTVDREVPRRLTLANGRSFKLRYETHTEADIIVVQPVLEIIIQQIFGCFVTPRVLGAPVLLKLLSPARRPLQITQDLEGFWQGAWPEICKEMKGRYPKHNWDYRVTE